jgi:hypothetical protein
MKKLALIAALAALPLSAYAAAPAPGAAPTKEKRAERMAEMEQHMRVMRTVGLAEALNLDAGQAMQMEAAMRPFDDRRHPLQEAIHTDGELLKRAADGDPSAQKDVDAALNRIFDNRAKMEAINREMLQALGQGMAPQQKAKLAMFLAHFKHEMGKGIGMRGHGPRGEE